MIILKTKTQTVVYKIVVSFTWLLPLMVVVTIALKNCPHWILNLMLFLGTLGAVVYLFFTTKQKLIKQYSKYLYKDIFYKFDYFITIGEGQKIIDKVLETGEVFFAKNDWNIDLITLVSRRMRKYIDTNGYMCLGENINSNLVQKISPIISEDKTGYVFNYGFKKDCFKDNEIYDTKEEAEQAIIKAIEKGEI